MEDKKGAEQPLSALIEKEVLVISIGVKTLAAATENCSALERFYEFGPKMGQFEGPKVFDPALFAAAVLDELEREEEDGTTPVHVLLDAAAEAAIQNGADGVKMPTDEDTP